MEGRDTTSAQPGRDPFDRRQKWLLVIAWGATLLPLVAFGYLTWKSYDMSRQLQMAELDLHETLAEIRELEKKKAELSADLTAQRESTKYYRDWAGVHIRFYRESDRKLVEGALRKLGFNVEDADLGKSRLIDRAPNTIGYGKLVAMQDLRDIGVALIQEGFPLKRIAPALKQQDPKLIQIYASVESDESCGLLTVEQVRAGETCGPKR
jgi:hypothetical protein